MRRTQLRFEFESIDMDFEGREEKKQALRGYRVQRRDGFEARIETQGEATDRIDSKIQR